MTKILLSLTLLIFSTSLLLGQNITMTIKVMDVENNEELIGATIFIPELSKGTTTDASGLGTFENIKEGTYGIEVSYIGFEKLKDNITVSSTSNTFTYYLEESEESLNEVVIQATRSTRTITDIPTRVEFIGGEELEEKALMNATNISMVLRESTGIQIQQTSLSSGNRSIRIQGLDGRYTQLLRDGFPLYGGFSGDLSIMQIPPLDLAQFEIIKGSVSTLYGEIGRASCRERV